MGSCCSLAVDLEKDGKEPEKGFGARVERFCKRLESGPFLVAGGLCLLASLLLTGHGCHGAGRAVWWDPALATAFICGVPAVREAFEALVSRKRIISALLISIAMAACLAIGQFFAAGEVAFIMALGTTIEAKTLKRARHGVAGLVSLVPPTARYVVTCPKCLAKGERFRDVPVESINVGDGVRVLPGETIPVDGTITEGTTSVDQSVVTGESLPVDKGPGDEVYSGTINRFGAVTIRVEKTGEDSSLQKMIRLVKEAERKKAPVQRIADKWAAILVPTALALAVAVFLGAWAWGGNASAALVRGVTILVVFCPCSLALATPTAIMAAIGQAAKNGVIVKSGEALERMGGVSVACMDKTGTVTTGRLSVSDIVAAPGDALGENGVLRLAASVESSSGHPLAKAIVAEWEKRGGGAIQECPAGDFSMVPGKGVKGKAEGREIACGTEAWLKENGVGADSIEAFAKDAERLRGEGKAVVFAAADGLAAGLVALSDTVRPEAKEAIADLAEAGVSPCLLTGDHAATAAAVARAVGVEEVHAELLPDRKAAAIESIQRGGRAACMVGDGVNDAPALKTAHVGIAMGGAGSDIAVDAADIALVGDDLSKLAYLKRLSNACVRTIKTGIAFSMSLNAVAIALSALGLLTPVTGALVHNAGSVLVVANSALLYDRKFARGRR